MNFHIRIFSDSRTADLSLPVVICVFVINSASYVSYHGQWLSRGRKIYFSNDHIQ